MPLYDLSGMSNAVANPDPGIMGTVGNYLNRDNQALIKALAIGGNVASIMGSGRMSNQPDTRAQQIAALVSSGAAGSSLAPKPVVPQQNTQAAQVQAPTTQPVSTQNTQVKDTNGNGTNADEMATLKLQGAGSLSRIQEIMRAVGDSGPVSRGSATPGLIGSSIANPTNSTGEQAGTPVADTSAPAPIVAPSVQNLNTVGISPEARNLQDIGMLLGPQAQMEVYKQQPTMMNAQTTSDIEHAKLYQLFGYSPEAQAQVELAKEAGKTQGARVAIEAFATSPLGQTVIPKSMIGTVPPGVKTYGDLARTGKDMDVIHQYMSLYTQKVVANINKSGTIGAADKQAMTALSQIDTTLGQEQRALIADINKRENPDYLAYNATDQQKASNFTTLRNLKLQLSAVNAQQAQTRSAINKLAGVKTAGTNTAPNPIAKPAPQVGQTVTLNVGGKKIPAQAISPTQAKDASGKLYNIH
jgi:hypothetical protein